MSELKSRKRTWNVVIYYRVCSLVCSSRRFACTINLESWIHSPSTKATLLHNGVSLGILTRDASASAMLYAATPEINSELAIASWN